MYRVHYLMNNLTAVVIKEFDSFREAVDFAIQQPENSILEIKHYDIKTNYIQNKSNNPR